MKIGPTFFSELQAAGCSDGVGVADDEVFFAPDTPDEYKARVEAVLAAHDPTRQALPPLPDEISPRQFYEEAAVEGIITKADALAFMVSKTLPRILAGPIAQLPDDQQFSAMMALMGTSYSRSNPFTGLVGQLIGKDAAAMDTFWRAAAAR